MQGSNGDADREKRLEDTVGKGERGTNWKSNAETYTLPWVKQTPSGNWLCDAGSSSRGLCDNLQGGRGWETGGRFKREEAFVHLWLIHVDVWGRLTQYCKAIILQLKINKKSRRPE